MKWDALSVAAVAVGGLAVYAYAKPKMTTAHAPAINDTGVVSKGDADTAIAQATASRIANGQALPQNTDYLGDWAYSEAMT